MKADFLIFNSPIPAYYNITFFIYRINKAFKIAIIYKIVIIYEKNKFSTSFSYS